VWRLGGIVFQLPLPDRRFYFVESEGSLLVFFLGKGTLRSYLG